MGTRAEYYEDNDYLRYYRQYGRSHAYTGQDDDDWEDYEDLRVMSTTPRRVLGATTARHQ